MRKPQTPIGNSAPFRDALTYFTRGESAYWSGKPKVGNPWWSAASREQIAWQAGWDSAHDLDNSFGHVKEQPFSVSAIEVQRLRSSERLKKFSESIWTIAFKVAGFFRQRTIRRSKPYLKRNKTGWSTLMEKSAKWRKEDYRKYTARGVADSKQKVETGCRTISSPQKTRKGFSTISNFEYGSSYEYSFQAVTERVTSKIWLKSALKSFEREIPSFALPHKSHDLRVSIGAQRNSF